MTVPSYYWVSRITYVSVNQPKLKWWQAIGLYLISWAREDRWKKSISLFEASWESTPISINRFLNRGNFFNLFLLHGPFCDSSSSSLSNSPTGVGEETAWSATTVFGSLELSILLELNKPFFPLLCDLGLGLHSRPGGSLRASILIDFPVYWARLRRMYSRFMSKYSASNSEESDLGASAATAGDSGESKLAENGAGHKQRGQFIGGGRLT